MAENVLKTKIALLYKTYAEWDLIKDTYTPLKGEVCFCDVPASSEEEKAVLFKVGNGVDTFNDLPWASALASDIYSWAKKESLDFKDLSPQFLAELEQYITEQGGGLTYRIIEKSDNVWQLQQKSKDSDWKDASGTIDITEDLAKKVDKEVKSGTTTSLIFNEADGGGAQITTSTNKGFAGVHDGTNPDETYATMYVKNANGTQTLVRLDLNADGTAHYLKNGERASSDNELVTFADIKDLEGALKFIGMTTRAKDSEGKPIETVEEAIERILEEKGHTPASGDVVIVDTAEYVYDGTKWTEIGDEGTYATKAEVGALEERVNEIEAEQASLADIAYSGDANDLKQTEGDILVLDCN